MATARRDYGDFNMVAAAAVTPWALKSTAKRKAQNEAKAGARQNTEDLRAKFTPDTQPRDYNGKFRKILARLKLNLGGEATQDLAQKIEATEQAQIAGNYEEMRKNSNDLLGMIDSIDAGSLPKGTVKNLRRGASELGKVLAYLPLPQGQENAKVRFTDLPPASKDMVRAMVERVQERLDPADAKKYVEALDSFMSGSRTMTSDEMAVNLNKLLRVLA